VSTTQVIYKEILGMPPFEPPEPKGKKTKYGQDDQCWLCGGETEGLGHHIKDVITSSFTDTNAAKNLESQTVCYSCAALMKKEAWQAASEKHGHSPYFPVKDGKSPVLSNWMFSSHVFSKDGWLRPSRQEFAEILCNPPATPFVIAIAEVGKKHVLFRSAVNYSKEQYIVQFDEEKILIDKEKFKEILRAVEAAYLFFSKDSILTGEYNQAAILKVGLKTWREHEDVLKPMRKQFLKMLKVACFVARKIDCTNEV
jgi:hypothetical protein